MTILVNKIRCKKCGEEIKSTYTHDFRSCKCGACVVDGEHEYLRQFGKSEKDNTLASTLPHRRGCGKVVPPLIQSGLSEDFVGKAAV